MSTPANQSDTDPAFRRLSLEDARELIDTRDVTVLDIRDDTSFAAARMAGACAFDNASAADFIATHPKDAAVIVCCYHGHSSQQAAAWLAAQGFGEVYSLDGGFTGWAARFPDDIEPLD